MAAHSVKLMRDIDTMAEIAGRMAGMLGDAAAGHGLSSTENATSYASYYRAVAYFRPPVTEPHCLTLSGERFCISLETDTEVVDELPLRVALKKTSPDMQNGKAELKWFVWNSQFAFLVKIDDCICLFDNTFDPMNDAVFRAL